MMVLNSRRYILIFGQRDNDHVCITWWIVIKLEALSLWETLEFDQIVYIKNQRNLVVHVNLITVAFRLNFKLNDESIKVVYIYGLNFMSHVSYIFPVNKTEYEGSLIHLTVYS